MSTIREVAERAGVSVKTVSRVLSGGDGVRAETREHVERVMAQMDYHPSAAARSLRGHGTGFVALIADHLTTTPDSFDIVRGIEAGCEAAGKLLMIGEAGGSVEAMAALYQEFRRQRAEAIIFATMWHRPVSIPERMLHGNLTLVNCFDPEDRFPAFVPDDRGGARAATLRLLEQGHRRVAYLGLVEGMVATRERMDGYLDALESRGINEDASLVRYGAFDGSPDEFKSLPDLLTELAALPGAPTALLCGNDKMAMRVFNVLHSRGIQVPRDVSVVGYDDYKMISENLIPRLTTVAPPYYQMGVRAVEAALGEPIPGRHRLPCALVERESTGEAPRSGR